MTYFNNMDTTTKIFYIMQFTVRWRWVEWNALYNFCMHPLF